MTAIERAERDLKRSKYQKEKATEAEGYSRGKHVWAMHYADVLERDLAALVEEAKAREREIGRLQEDLDRHEAQIRHLPDTYLGKIYIQGFEAGRLAATQSEQEAKAG
jgi:hypothetical protein